MSGVLGPAMGRFLNLIRGPDSRPQFADAFRPSLKTGLHHRQNLASGLGSAKLISSFQAHWSITHTILIHKYDESMLVRVQKDLGFIIQASTTARGYLLY